MSSTLPPLSPVASSNGEATLSSESRPLNVAPSALRASVKAPKLPSTTSMCFGERFPSRSASPPSSPKSPASRAPGFPRVSDSYHEPSFEQMSANHILQDLLTEKMVTPRLVADCDEQQLLLIFPLVLHSVQSHVPTDASPLLRPLLMRLCSSRRLKLRFLLLRKHPAFLKLQLRISFVSRGYNQWCFARGSSASQSSCLAHKRSRDIMRVPVDMVDLQSEDFFRHVIFEQPRKDKYDFGFQLISHPFRAPTLPQEHSFNGPDEEGSLHFSSQSNNIEDYYPDHQLAESATVRVEMDQTAIELRHLSFEEDIVHFANMRPLFPRLIIRTGTNMLKVQLCQMMLVFFNCVWSVPSLTCPDVQAAPICVTLDVIASGMEHGIIRAFCHTQSFSRFCFDFWQDTRGRDPSVADQFIRSAAGAFTAAYICGINTLQKDTFCVKDGAALYLHAFEDVFQGPAQPKVGIPKVMKRCLKDIGIWDNFHACCLRGFHSLRERYEEIFHILSPLFSALCKMDEESISSHLSSKYCFNMKVANARKAAKVFRKWLG